MKFPIKRYEVNYSLKTAMKNQCNITVTHFIKIRKKNGTFLISTEGGNLFVIEIDRYIDDANIMSAKTELFQPETLSFLKSVPKKQMIEIVMELQHQDELIENSKISLDHIF